MSLKLKCTLIVQNRNYNIDKMLRKKFKGGEVCKQYMKHKELT